MKKISIILLFLYCFIDASAQKNLGDLSDTTATYIIHFQDQTYLSGKIISQDSTKIVFNDFTVGKVNVLVKSIKSIKSLKDNQFCTITTHDGKIFTGLLVAQNAQEAIIRTDNLGDITLPNSKIRNIEMMDKEQLVNGKFYFPNPHPTRYFFGPSAIPLAKGEAYFQNAYILSNSFQYGLTKNFSIGGGIVIPLAFYVTPKVGFKVGKYLHVGGGVLAMTSFFNFGAAVGYGSITIGSKEHNVTLNAGWGAVKQQVSDYDTVTYSSTYRNQWSVSQRPMFSVSGMTRIAERLSIVSENWFFAIKKYTPHDYYVVVDKNDPIYQAMSQPTYTYQYQAITSLGLRVMGKSHSVDIAALIPVIDAELILIPYIDYVFKF